MPSSDESIKVWERFYGMPWGAFANSDSGYWSNPHRRSYNPHRPRSISELRAEKEQLNNPNIYHDDNN